MLLFYLWNLAFLASALRRVGVVRGSAERDLSAAYLLAALLFFLSLLVPPTDVFFHQPGLIPRTQVLPVQIPNDS